MPINQIVTPLDSAVLENKEQYAIYFKIINHAFKEVFTSVATQDICNSIELSFLKQYGDLLTYSLEAFRIKYLYDEEEKMQIDLTESGFPNYLEFRYLFNDLMLKDEHISKLPHLEKLKEEFLERLLKNKEPILKRQLEQAASIVYYTSVEKNYIFKKFVQGKIITQEEGQDSSYLVSWAFYDVIHNRPFICFMYFDLHKTKLEEYTKEIYDVLKKTADRNISLDMMAYAIDKKLPKLRPKKIKKIDLGPLHNVFAKDELEITHVILKGIVEKTLPLSSYSFSLSLEETTSKGNFKEGSFFNKQELQLWEENKKQKYIFSSHRVMQLLYSEMPEKMDSLNQELIEIPELIL